jgi:pectate lyase
MKTKVILTSIILVYSGIFSGCRKDEAALISSTGGANSALVAAAASTCSAQGWASQNGGTTGGGSAAITVVSTYATLKAAIENTSVKVIQVNGTITIPSAGRISFQDQTGKTIFGSSGAKLVSADQTKSGSGIIYVKRCNNIIIRNLIFEGPGAYDTDGWDNCTLDACKNVWVDHCEFRDGVDGNFDIKNTSDFITVSWCKFTYLKAPKPGGPGGADDHRYTNLIGSSDSATGDRGRLNITFSHCWWGPGCVERMPRVRFGKIHIVNSFFNSTVSNKCIQAAFEANILAEADVFENVKEPINLMSGYTAIQVKNCVFTNTTGNKTGSGTAFTPPYTITVQSASSVKSTVTASNGAGATLSGNTCGSI